MLIQERRRYGSLGMDEKNTTLSEGGIAITVDVKMPEDSPIQELRSPSHPISVTLGKTSASESQPLHLSRASASLALGTSTLDKDFVLEIIHQVRRMWVIQGFKPISCEYYADPEFIIIIIIRTAEIQKHFWRLMLKQWDNELSWQTLCPRLLCSCQSQRLSLLRIRAVVCVRISRVQIAPFVLSLETYFGATYPLHVFQGLLYLLTRARLTPKSGGTRTETLIAALRVFLKSLPVGIKFNICYFGDFYSFLFPESQVYDQNSLEKALRSLDGLNGKCGGTKTLEAVQASIRSRDNEQPLSVILATDGDIWQQQELFDYLNSSVAASKKTLRVFALGIGESVSRYVQELLYRSRCVILHMKQCLEVEMGFADLLGSLNLIQRSILHHTANFFIQIRLPMFVYRSMILSLHRFLPRHAPPRCRKRRRYVLRSIR